MSISMNFIWSCKLSKDQPDYSYKKEIAKLLSDNTAPPSKSPFIKKIRKSLQSDENSKSDKSVTESNGDTNGEDNEVSIFDDFEDPDFLEHKLMITSAQLGLDADRDQPVVVSVESRGYDYSLSRVPVIFLRAPDQMRCVVNLDLSLSHDVRFYLESGTGPVHICGVEKVSLRDEEDSEDFDQSDMLEALNEEEDEEMEENEVEELKMEASTDKPADIASSENGDVKKDDAKKDDTKDVKKDAAKDVKTDDTKDVTKDVVAEDVIHSPSSKKAKIES